MGRLSLRHALAATLLGSILAAAGSAVAATQAESSDEIGGASVAARATAQGLQSAWGAQIVANGGTPEAPMTLTQPTFTAGAPVEGIINTAADGTTTSVSRTQYTGGASPEFVGVSPNPGTASCTRSGTALQARSPRPTSLVSDGTCSDAAGFGYSEQGGVGESTTRDAVEFTFSRPVLGFGAWFGDLETRTDGGVAALVRLHGADGALLSEQPVEPGPSYLPQSDCGGRATGCGNNTTRWIGFVADPLEPVTRMVVIVGDNNVGGNALNGGLSFIGPTLDLSTATISLDKTALPLTDTDDDGLIGAGDTIQYDFDVTNTGSLPVSAVSITDPAAEDLVCPPGPLAAGETATCTGTHVLTQAEVDSGSFTNTATAEAAAYSGTIASAPNTDMVTIPADPELTLIKSVDEPTYDVVGDVLTYTVDVSNSGNVSLAEVDVTDQPPGFGAFDLDCSALPQTLPPGESGVCTATYAVTQEDLDTGSITNVASASASGPDQPVVAPESEVTSTAVQTPAMTATKSVDAEVFAAAGDTLTYAVEVTNEGNVTLTEVAVTDQAPGSGSFELDCESLPATLPPGATGSCAATYTVTPADVQAGQVANTAAVDATSPTGPLSVVTPPAVSDVEITASPEGPEETASPEREDSSGAAAPGESGPVGGSDLPETGAGDFRSAGILGLALLCTGAALVAQGRRRQQSD